MRIGIFSECYHPTLNGVVVSIDTFKKEMEAMGHEVFIVAPKVKNFKDDDESHILRYPSTTMFGPNDYPIGLTFLAPSIKKKICKLNLDIIHAQHSLGMISVTAMKVARSCNIPIIHTYHTKLDDYIHWKVGAFLGRWYVRTMSTRFCNKCDYVVTPSPSMKKIIEDYGVKTPIEPIPTGIDIESFQHPFSREELKEKWNIDIPQEKKVLLYLSRVASEKNIDFLFEAISQLSQKRNDFYLIMGGGGQELEDFKKKAIKLKIDKITSFTDKLPKEDAERLFGAADIFVFSSITETQGIVIVEAMAAGIPAVAVGIMGPTDVIKDGKDGFLTALKIDEFSDRISQLLDDEDLRKRMGAKAKVDAEEFSTSACAKKMENLYINVKNNYRSR